MRVAVTIAAVLMFAGVPADAADDAAKKPDGKLEIVPMGPPKPPDLGLPRQPVTPPERGTPASERYEQHEDPPAQGRRPDGLDRGEGFAALPSQTPSGIKALEDWIGPIFP
ncbi:MAG: hypothetical protein JO128_18255 [Alphaproteobacteria bacterium]|nr:hypothetical protein [Alphaproteobacteria bacterium]